MKKYNKILEAIDRGILLVLDDYDDEIQSNKVGLYKDQISTKDNVELIASVVDLGLPSGTLWCKYNLGVNPNILSNPEEWYGDYYAWGEIEPSTTVDFKTKKCSPDCKWYNYKYANWSSWSNKDILTKYCTEYKYGHLYKTDDLSELLPEDDAAILNIHIGNFKFHIPTKELFNELLYNTTQIWETNYNNIKGLNGMKFIGTNGNTIFIPAAGNCTDSNLYSVSDSIFVWTSSLYCENSLSAWIYSPSYYDKDKKYLNTYNRCFGLSIRPVCNLN